MHRLCWYIAQINRWVFTCRLHVNLQKTIQCNMVHTHDTRKQNYDFNESDKGFLLICETVTLTGPKEALAHSQLRLLTWKLL